MRVCNIIMLHYCVKWPIIINVILFLRDLSYIVIKFESFAWPLALRQDQTR